MCGMTHSKTSSKINSKLLAKEQQRAIIYPKEVKPVKERVACVALIKQLHDGLEKQANNSLRSQDLTMSQVGVLIELRFSPEKQMALKELERRLHVAQSTAAGIVVRLEQKGFVEGFGDANDRRIKMLRITPAGEECCQLADQHMAAFEETLLTGLTEAERTTFVALLKRAASNLK